LSSNSKKMALIVFAREPKEGKVKTRLCKDLPPPTVTQIYKAFVRDVLSIALKTHCDERFIYYVGTGFSIPFLRRAGKGFLLKRQMGKDLGRRMYKAFAHCQKQRFERIVIIGTDCVTLMTRDIERAFQKLEAHDCVLGPSKDGGYYLIGLKAPHRKIFSGVKWSTSLVLEQTLHRARQLNKKVFLLRSREDVDTVADLRKLSRRISGSGIAGHTQKVLKKLSL